jgi:hypothetical protein
VDGVYFGVPQSSVPWGGCPFFYVGAGGVQDRESGFVTCMQISEDQGQLFELSTATPTPPSHQADPRDVLTLETLVWFEVRMEWLGGGKQLSGGHCDRGSGMLRLPGQEMDSTYLSDCKIVVYDQGGRVSRPLTAFR